MQRDVKIGIVIGVLLILLLAVFWMSRRDTAPQTIPEEEGTSVADLSASEDPVAPEEHGSVYLPESPEVAVAPLPSGPAGPSATGVNPMARLEGPATPPAVAPAPSAPATTPALSAPAAKVFHTIKAGETLSDISTKYYGTATKWRLIKDANREKIPDENRLRVGLKIIIPDAQAPAGSPAVVPVAIPAAGNATPTVRKHTVGAGDTLSSIAAKYYGDETQWRKIFDANRNVLRNPDRLNQGVELVIP